MFINLSNRQFGRLTVERYAGRNQYGESTWLCLCSCGKQVTVRGSNLRNGTTRSCGCLRTKHGHATTPEYQAYQGAKQRCTNPGACHWDIYGGRGVKFRFRSFQQFLKCIGPKPSPDFVLDRTNVNGHYEKGNVRWISKQESARNRRGTKLNEAKVREIRARHAGGVTQTELAADYGISSSTMSQVITGKRWADVPPKKPSASVKSPQRAAA